MDVLQYPPNILIVPTFANYTKSGRWNVYHQGLLYREFPVHSIFQKASKAWFDLVDVECPTELQRNNTEEMLSHFLALGANNHEVNLKVVPRPAELTTVKQEPLAYDQDLLVQPPEHYRTNEFGDYKFWGELPGDFPVRAGNLTLSPQMINIVSADGYPFTSKVIDGAAAFNAEKSTAASNYAVLVPPRGITIISDVDDVLRVAKYWRIRQALVKAATDSFTQWPNMSSVYADWAARYPDAHFHYATLAPRQISRRYIDFLRRSFPPGSIETRDSDIFEKADVLGQTAARDELVRRVYDSFPGRAKVLVGDTSNANAVEVYARFLADPRTACVLMRHTAATEPDFWKLPDLRPLARDRDLRRKVFFFDTPEDVRGLRVDAAGRCSGVVRSRDPELDGGGAAGGIASLLKLLGMKAHCVWWFNGDGFWNEECKGRDWGVWRPGSLGAKMAAWADAAERECERRARECGGPDQGTGKCRERARKVFRGLRAWDHVDL